MIQNFSQKLLRIARLLLIISVLGLFSFSTKAQFTGLIVNEFSQGTSGSKEFIELLVVGTRTCTDSTADLRNWIVDDNNGWYGGNGTGIARGHYKFANVTNWSKVPFGSIILIYNGDDKNNRITNADDPTDANKDYTYIVRLGSTSLILENTDEPSSPSSPNYVYPNASNTADYSSSSDIWVSIVGLANGGDAIIVVSPTDRTNPFFSITYSLATTPKTPTVKLGALGSGDNAFLSNANYSTLSSWVVGSAGTSDETPGQSNTTANATWINSMRVQVTAVPPSVSNTTGTNTVCVGATTTLSNTTPSGVWSSDNTVVANVNSTGLVSGISAGTANIIYTVTNACGTTSKSFTVTIASPPSTPTIATIDPTCISSGSITVTSPTGTGFTYSKDGTNFQTSPVFSTGIAAGNYTITVKNSSGCNNSASATINPAPSAPATPLFNVIQPTCAVATGSIGVTIVSGITYSIDGTNFSASPLFINLSPNTYTITAKNTTGCTSTATAIINAQPTKPPTPVLTEILPVTCITTSGVNVTSPATGVTYSIDGVNFVTTSLFLGLTPNQIYTVTVKNSISGCTSSNSITLQNLPTAPTVPVLTISQAPTCTIATGTITVTPQSGVTYSIKNEDGTGYEVLNQTSSVFAGLVAGKYTVTVTNSLGCINVQSILIQGVPSAPATPATTVVQPNCTVPTGSITVTTIPGLTYTFGSTTFTTSTTFNNLTPNTYTITATNSGGCIASTTVVINAPSSAPAAPTVTTPITYCQNATASALTATGTNLLWYGTAATGGTSSVTAPTPITTASGNTTYYVSQTVGGCESPRAAIVVSVTATPAAPTVTTPITYCQNTTATTLTATGTNLLWYGTFATGSTGSNIAPTPVTTASGSTTYYISQTVNNCESPRAAIVVSVTATPSAPTVSTPVTYCQSATASALTAAGTNLLWYGTAATGGTSSATAPTPVTSASGNTTYYVSQTINSCESPRAAMVVLVTATPAAPTVTTPVTYCQNTTASALTATGTNFLWYGTAATGGTSNATATIPSTSASGNTTYYVSQTISSCESPRAAIVVSITAAPAAPTVTTPVNYCLNATPTALTATGTALKWYGTIATGGTASATAPIPPTITGGSTNYYVSQTVGSCESPRAAINVIVIATPTPTVVSPITFCQNATATPLTATGTNLLWYGTAATGGTSSSTAPTPLTAIAGTTNYYVSQTVSGCESPRASIAVNIETFTITLSANPDPAFGGVAFTGQITANLPIASSIWQPSNLFVNNLSTQTIVAPDTSFTLVVTGVSANGCRSTTSKLITVVPSNNTIFIPNALTPAAVGTDASVVKVYGTTIKTAQLLVYNQWGQLIFQTDSATTKGWDGTFNGKAQPSGVYTYVVRVVYQNNKVATQSGSINLIR